MTIEEMKARLAEIQDGLRAMHEEAGDAALSEERQTEWDALADERGTLIKDLERAEARVSLVGDLAQKPGHTESGTERKAPAFHKDHGQEMFDLDEVRAMSYGASDFLGKVDDFARRAIDKAKFGVRDEASAQEHALELLEEVDNSNRDLAKRYLATGSEDYASGFAKVMRHGSDAFCTQEERQALLRAQSFGTDNQGGYAVPFQLDPTVILTNAGTVNPIRQLARIERIVGKEYQLLSSAGTTVSRDAEAEEVSDDSFTLAQPTVGTKRVQGFVPFSIEIDLSWSALRSEITRALVDAKNREEDSFITGDATGNAPQGINAGLVSAGQDVTVATADTFVIADLYKLEEALAPRWEDNASWLAHKSVYNLIRQIDTAGGSNLWVRIGDGTPPRLLDYPDYRTSALPSWTTAKAATTGTADSTVMIFGDFKQFLIVDRIGMTVEMIPHLFGSNRRPTGQRGVYAVWMNNSKIVVPGAFKRLINL